MATGTTTLDFGATPGTNYVTTTVIGQAAIASNSHVEAYLMSEATATHNAYEHSIVPLEIRCGSIVAGTGFSITANSNLRLNGTFNVHWVWA